MDTDTDLGGQRGAFPVTRCSLVRDSNSPDPKVRKIAQETLLSAYWKPVYKYIRVHWKASNEDAKDLTQTFFARALEKEFFDRFDPAKSRFRTFLRLCVDGLIQNERRAAGRMKRGGQTTLFPLDFEGADDELRHHEPSVAADLDDAFRQEWIRGLFGQAVEDLRRLCTESGKTSHFALFERYDLGAQAERDGLTYAKLGEEFGLGATQVTNYLAFARSRFREFVLQRLRLASGSDEEYRDEVRGLFGRGLA
jgi:RNA polymerase sigma factor (sigma-70 family)